MKVSDAIAAILKKEGIDTMVGYPVNHIIEAGARADIRTVIVRQERIGLHMADAMSRMTSGDTIGTFVMQHGPGAENAFGGVAQAFGESVPILVMPQGYGQANSYVKPNFNSTINFQHVTKNVEPLIHPGDVPDVMRRAFSLLRNGRGGPVMVEVPSNMMNMDYPHDTVDYTPVQKRRSAPNPADVERVADTLVAAKSPIIFAGQGVHWAKAWEPLKQLAELLACPVTSSLSGKSTFPESHDLSIGTANKTHTSMVGHYVKAADVVFGVGCSFTTTNFGIKFPAGKTYIHGTLDPNDLNKNLVCDDALVGDAGLMLEMLVVAVADRLKGKARDRSKLAQEIVRQRTEWLASWQRKTGSNETPICPYRVLSDLHNTVDRHNTIITHDAGSPRDQIVPFWQSENPLSYIGWGKTTQLGYGLGLAMGAKLARPDQLCINVWGDAAIGFTGMDFETAVRENIPILSILLNNFCMAIELKVLPVGTEKFRNTDISGDYAAMARAFGGHGERVTDPGDIIPAIKRGIQATQDGQAALVEFITSKETEESFHMG